ncbi:hypothetical protein VZ95_19100 [Elstera litoralis]|uniref:BrnA antitoxin of type II toxin-antitoxin system n=1 Tax=Elstera litoralis TaxID=552518 RepID=A0A0F3IRM1_9PROT|nr:BrnA antitoxin family protein [Elstera litoralis]KJV08234.1 hypothetical protein VZ95_19100 [Elstera litoralis]
MRAKPCPACARRSPRPRRAVFAQIHTPEEIVSRGRGRPAGSKQATTKEAVKIRLDADVLAALRASGDGWQTRINDTLRASLALSGKIPRDQ